jgi:ApaG protein
MPSPGRGAPFAEPAYEARTRDILVRVTPSYLEDRSRPEEGEWAWAYAIDIENHGEETVTLVTRHWFITDGLNRTEEVAGPGVVGEQPTLAPGEAFRYQSGCPLPTPSGSMRGSYRMVSETGEGFDVEIPEFSLHLPGATRRMN